MECQKESNLENCNCSCPSCPRKGICCECVAYHRERKELPACFFSDDVEKEHDRSVERFVEVNS
tara:strand:+ start:3705 stop:3896 length:192 start_codon:yes stop_codon:yes gene_type:complete